MLEEGAISPHISGEIFRVIVFCLSFVLATVSLSIIQNVRLNSMPEPGLSIRPMCTWNGKVILKNVNHSRRLNDIDPKIEYTCLGRCVHET